MSDAAFARARRLFPLVESCVYLNSNSTGAVPGAVRGVLERHWQTMAAWRDEVWGEWWTFLHAHADAIAALLGAPAGSVVLDVSTAALLGRLAAALDYPETRPRALVSDLEFPTAAFLWRALGRIGAELHVVAGDGVAIDEDALVAAIDERTRVVFVSHAAYATGAVIDVRRVVDRARAVGAIVGIDAYASVGVMPVDVGALDVDFAVGGARKWLCGASDLAFLYVRPELAESLAPLTPGWMAGADPLSFGPAVALAPSAGRFAAGTPSVLPAYVSAPGLAVVSSLGVAQIREHSLALTSRVIERADDAGIPVATPRDPTRRGGVVNLRPPAGRAAAEALRRRGFVCSYRDGVRVGPHFYNTLDEVDRLMDALVQVADAAGAARAGAA